jgi:hypothetical protein
MDIVHGNRYNSDMNCINPLADKEKGRENKRKLEEIECTVRENEIAQAMLAAPSDKEMLDRG